MTDVAQTEIHPDTLAELKDQLPILRQIAADYDTNLLTQVVRQSADEMRRLFPGLDDLTLAAIAMWEAQKAHGLLHIYQHPSWEKEMVAAALVAVDLSWSLLTPDGSHEAA